MQQINYEFITFITLLLYIELLIVIIKSKKGGVSMKKAVKIVSVFTLVLFILVNIPNVALCFLYSMPDDAKEDSVCFLTPELTWNSTISDVREYFGEPVETVSEKADAFDIVLGRIKTDTFSTVLENHPVEVKATRRCFSPFTLFRRKKVYKYTFTIKCNDAQDEKAVFDRFCGQLIESRASDGRFHYNKEGNVLTAVRYYGPFWSGDDAEYQIEYIEGGADEVVFKMSSVFDL